MNPGLLVITFEWKFLQMTHCAGTIGKPRALANAISTKPWLARHTICHRDARIKKNRQTHNSVPFFKAD